MKWWCPCFTAGLVPLVTDCLPLWEPDSYSCPLLLPSHYLSSSQARTNSTNFEPSVPFIWTSLPPVCALPSPFLGLSLTSSASPLVPPPEAFSLYSRKGAKGLSSVRPSLRPPRFPLRLHLLSHQPFCSHALPERAAVLVSPWVPLPYFCVPFFSFPAFYHLSFIVLLLFTLPLFHLRRSLFASPFSLPHF